MRAKRLGALLLLSGTLCLLCGCNFMDYQKANSLLDQGNYEEARAIYTQMEENGGYKDSADMLKECDYVEAGSAYEAGDYSHAMELYEDLESYEDAPEQLKKAQYGYALQRKEEGDLGGAYALFAALGDYEDCAAMVQDCAARSLEDPQVGDAVFFGSFEQDGNEDNGPELIQWRVLAREGDHLLLASEHLLGRMKYGETSQWEASGVRTWLNGAFYDAAFSREEQGHIQKTLTCFNWEALQNTPYGNSIDELRGEIAAIYEMYSGEEAKRIIEDIEASIHMALPAVEDHVFLLSAQEVRGLFSEDGERSACLTKAAEMEGSGASGWWTRAYADTGWDNQVVVTVGHNGKIECVHPSQGAGVRPTICLSLSGRLADEPLDLELFGYPSADLYDTAAASSGSSSGSNTCPCCGGTGAIRFYYGSSDLEAILSGHDPYTLGTCPMCNGRGHT